MPTTSAKRRAQQRDYHRRKAKRLAIPDVSLMPDRLLTKNPSTVEQAEAAMLMAVVCKELRAKRRETSGHVAKTSNLREYWTGTSGGMRVVTEVR